MSNQQTKQKFICEYTDVNQSGITAYQENDPTNIVTFDTFAGVEEFGQSPDIDLLLIQIKQEEQTA